VGGLHSQTDQKGREEIRALAGRLARRREAAQGLSGILQEDEPAEALQKAKALKAEALGIRF